MRCAKFAVLCFWVMATVAWAGGPRFVTGFQFPAATAGVAMAWRTSQPLYFTDPGDLAATVTHAQADAMVAAAAAVWNIAPASLVLAQGGTLAEHISGGNTYFDGNGVVFPADVAASNYLSKPIAVVYDTDGSVTDLLLGQGASSPSSCRQNSVTESVDAFGPAGTIDHAVLVLNGRCVGTNAQQMLQMQYEVMRGFGRLVGLAWSQTNDNVFTSTPTPTAVQMAHWPVMHPIDVICGVYTYQCMQNPFVLREDDISALVMLYPVTTANLAVGKVISTEGGTLEQAGYVLFPEGRGMQEVNVTVALQPFAEPINPWQTASSVTGYLYEQNIGNPVTGPASENEEVGTYFDGPGGQYDVRRVLLGGATFSHLTTEPINPLYRGAYALGPFERPVTIYSGQLQTTYNFSTQYPVADYDWNVMTMAGGATGCTAGTAGVVDAPGAADPSGWWPSALCTRAAAGWWKATVRAGRSWTLEETAVDELGGQTVQKAQLVAGVWEMTSGSVAALQGAPMNSQVPGMTQLAVPAATADATYRFVAADQFGMGRPDFGFKMRMLYADNISPATLGSSGGTIAINGTGFAKGNRVTVNGVVAKVVSWSATQIVAVAPALGAANATVGVPVSVGVTDLTTAGSTVMLGAFTYTGTSVRAIAVKSVASFVAAGAKVSVPVAMAATQDGAGVAGVAVNWTATPGLGLSAASGVTDTAGLASVVVLDGGLAAGEGWLQGCAWSTVCGQWHLVSVEASQWIVGVAQGAGQSVASAGTLGPVLLRVTDAAGDPLLGAPVTVSQTVTAWEGVCPVHGRCASAPVLASGQSMAVTDANGLVTVMPMQVPGVAQVVSVAASSGTNGFVTLTLVKTP